LLRASL